MWVGFGVFKVVVHIHTIIMHVNKLHCAQYSCLLEDGMNYQIRVTSFIPLWGNESWNGKPGIPKRKQKLWPSDELSTF